MIPSNEALYYHWKRSCWVLHMFRQADKNSMVLQPITEYGWTISDNKLTVVWDTPRNMQAIRDRVNLLLKGCKCVTCCTTKRCGCKRKNTHCSEGCQLVYQLLKYAQPWRGRRSWPKWNFSWRGGNGRHYMTRYRHRWAYILGFWCWHGGYCKCGGWWWSCSLEDMQWLFITITCNVSKKSIFSPSGSHFVTMTLTQKFWCIKCLYIYLPKTYPVNSCSQDMSLVSIVLLCQSTAKLQLHLSP